MNKILSSFLPYLFLIVAVQCTSEEKALQTPDLNQNTQVENEVNQIYNDMDLMAFKEMQTALPEDVVILDVRTDAEVAEGMIPGARQIDFRSDSFKEEVAKLDTTKTYVVYCRTGGRSAAASKIMTEELGFDRVNNLLGGYSQYSSNQ